MTFTAVAGRTGISRTTLYRRPDLRELIEQHRGTTPNTLAPAHLAAQIDQLRHTLQAVAASVRRHKEQLRALNRTGHAG